MPLSSFATWCTPSARHASTYTHLILSRSSYIPATSFSVLVISLFASQHAHIQAKKNTYKNTECKGKCTYSTSQILTWTAIILSPLSSWHLTDNDVIVSSRGGLPLIEVGASERARACVCSYLSKASPGHSRYCLAYQTSCQVFFPSLSPTLSLLALCRFVFTLQ